MQTRSLRGILPGRQGVDLGQQINPFRAPGKTPMDRGPSPQAARAAERAHGPRVRGRFGTGGQIDVTA